MKIITSGKRKTAVARAILTEGSGKIQINDKDYKNLQVFNKLKIEEPLRIAQKILGKTEFNIQVQVRGGGEKGQIEAARVAISRAILNFSKSKDLETAFLNYDRNLLVADARRKETYNLFVSKEGLSYCCLEHGEKLRGLDRGCRVHITNFTHSNGLGLGTNDDCCKLRSNRRSLGIIYLGISSSLLHSENPFVSSSSGNVAPVGTPAHVFRGPCR